MAVKHHDSNSKHHRVDKGGIHHHGGSTHVAEHEHAHHGNKTKKKTDVHAPHHGPRSTRKKIHTAHPKVNHSRKKGGHVEHQKEHYHLHSS